MDAAALAVTFGGALLIVAVFAYFFAPRRGAKPGPDDEGPRGGR